jgi:pimeloyl-ACP methyl ester carboxylesterase
MELIQVQGIDVHLEGEGSEIILMMHGWPDTYRLWDKQVEHLKSRYRCARFSLPGFEIDQAPRPVSLLQMVELIKAIIDAINPGGSVSLMLHDWGCVFGYQFAAAYPSKVKRIIAVDIGDTFSAKFFACLSMKAKLSIAAYQLWLALAFSLGSVGTRMTRFMARLLHCPADQNRIGAQQNYPYKLQWTGGFKGAVNYFPLCPMLYIYGTNKPFMFHSPSWLEKLAARPGNEVVAMNTNHWVMIAKPEEFNTTVARWLA